MDVKSDPCAARCRRKYTVPLKAELKSENLIWAEVNVNRPFNPSAYRITDAKGNVIKVAGVLPNGSATTLITPAEPLDKKRVYYLEIPSLNLRAHCSFDGWFRETYSTKELGANIDGDKTTIRLFAPRANLVKVHLYRRHVMLQMTGRPRQLIEGKPRIEDTI